MSAIQSALLFLISTVFDIYLFILVVRIILVWIGANYFDPITQVIVKLTDMPVKPLRRIIPNVRKFELASIVFLLVLQLIKFFLISVLSLGVPSIVGILLLAIGDSIRLLLQTFFYAIILQVIISWVQPYSTMNYFLIQFTAPIMRPLQRVIPPIGGFDITPIPALVILQLLIILIATPIMNMGMTASYG